jgi:hypothetical protein
VRGLVPGGGTNWSSSQSASGMITGSGAVGSVSGDGWGGEIWSSSVVTSTSGSLSASGISGALG